MAVTTPHPTSGTARTATVRRRVARLTRRNSYRAVELYAQGLSLRGTISLAEVRGLRRLLEFQLSRPAMRPDPETQLEIVRARHAVPTLGSQAPLGHQVRGEWVERPGVRTRSGAVVLYVHGGAFVAGSPRSHRGLTSELARRTRRSVFSVDYRLAPEYTFPAAADDVLRAYSWLLSRGVPAARIVVMGDSAGGHLALGLTPRAARAGLPAPGAVVAFSPLVDPSMELSKARERELVRRDRLVGSGAGRAAIRRYHPGVALDHPELLLTKDDLSALPPVLIQASSDEILAADAEAYLEALRAAGGQGELRLWPRQWHVFQVAFRISRSAGEALDQVEEFVSQHVPLEEA